jgi:hypothetical protein
VSAGRADDGDAGARLGDRADASRRAAWREDQDEVRGYLSVQPADAYSTAVGYGWVNPLTASGSEGAFDRGDVTGSQPQEALRRDGRTVVAARHALLSGHGHRRCHGQHRR